MKLVSKILVFALTLVSAAGCGVETPKFVPESIIPSGEYTEKPADFTVFNPRVDILFVIDNSGSMSDAQANLSSNAYLFADAISKASILDFHIGVITTDMETCRFGTGLPGTCGQLGGFPAYVQKNTVGLVEILSKKMLVGTAGSAVETMFAPPIAALSPPLDTTVNAGFYRPDAYLAIIFITDADDQSKFSAKDTIQFLTLKKGDANKVLAYSVMRTRKTEQTCKSSESITGKLEEFMGLVTNSDITQKNILSLCTPDYGQKLAEFAADIIKRSSGRVKLNRVPDLKTLKVFFGTQEIPNDSKKGWVYEISTNSIILSADIDWDLTQGPNASLRVDFTAIDMEPQ